MGTDDRGGRRASLRRRLLSFMLPLAAAATALTGWASWRVAGSVLTEQLERRARETSLAAAQLPEIQAGLRERRESLILPHLQRLARAGTLYAAALDPRGRVVAHSDIFEKGKLLDGEAAFARRVTTLAGPAVEVSVPVWAESAQQGEEFVLGAGQAPKARLGSFRVALPLGGTLETASRIAGQVIAAVVAVNALFFSILIVFVNRTGDELDAMVSELARSNQELEEYAFVASHDLQEPLRRMGNFSELLARRYRGRLDDDADRYLDYITGGARRMQALLKDVLSLSQVRRGPLATRPVDLDAVLSETLSRLKPELDAAGAEVLREPLPAVLGDPRQIGLLLQNLIANAVKFRRSEPPAIRVSAREEGGSWVVSVSDNGIGIEPRHLEKVFALFQRLQAQDAFPGTGLGLALCKKVVERHGGRIWAESALGVGTTIRFTLPKAPPPETA